MGKEMSKLDESSPFYKEIPDEERDSTDTIFSEIRHVHTSKLRRSLRCCRKRLWGGIIVSVTVMAIVAFILTRPKKVQHKPPYSLSKGYSGEDFFAGFKYHTDDDRDESFVNYASEDQAKKLNLTYTTSDTAILRVDHSSTDASNGRSSVRVESMGTYNGGLFIFNIRHTPYGCGVWPSLRLVNPSSWPESGEIDIMESFNKGVDGNRMSLHTEAGCSMSGVPRNQTGTARQENCDHEENDNGGCSVTTEPYSFGEELNAGGGGTMAMEWLVDGIRIWQFTDDNTPPDIIAKSPKPGGWGTPWGTPAAEFPSDSCDIGSHFKDLSIVADIGLCGKPVSASWGDSNCPSNCTDYVANNPDGFKNAYWNFASIEVYQPPTSS